MAILVFVVIIWMSSIVAGQDVGASKGRVGWAWGLLLGWLGVLILSFLGPRRRALAHKSFRLTRAGDVLEPAAAGGAARRPGLPPPGWYADPNDATNIRYWGGAAWTEYVAEERAARPSLATTSAPRAALALSSTPRRDVRRAFMP